MVPRHPEALDFHHQYQEITIPDITIIVVTQASILETMPLFKVLPPLMHHHLALLRSIHHPQVLPGITHHHLDPLGAMVHLLPR
jgi:hypothetical protein